MLQYADGSDVRVGDAVLIEDGRTQATVVDVVVTQEQMRQTGVNVPGVMLKSAPFGLVYLPSDLLAEDPLYFVSRA